MKGITRRTFLQGSAAGAEPAAARRGSLKARVAGAV